ncbi:FHA domain protein [Mycobacterium xenopi 4042]|uniref:FHA domain protein n=1 Tax=Mycobacterium xenopi 4042 TaxID=1299334 RepID=X7ZXG4_MYCXE|nr:FHA domain protein [Mycobacterium xenopi 4042]
MGDHGWRQRGSGWRSGGKGHLGSRAGVAGAASGGATGRPATWEQAHPGRATGQVLGAQRRCTVRGTQQHFGSWGNRHRRRAGAGDSRTGISTGFTGGSAAGLFVWQFGVQRWRWNP